MEAWKTAPAESARATVARQPGLALTNGEATIAPAGALGVLTAGDEDTTRYTLSQATQVGDLPLCIAAAEIPASGEGFGYLDGRPHPVLMTSAGYAAISVGDRIGLTIDAWTSQAQPTGPLVVLAKISDSYQVLAAVQPLTDLPLMELTADPSGGTVTAKRVDGDGAVTGSNETFTDASAW